MTIFAYFTEIGIEHSISMAASRPSLAEGQETLVVSRYRNALENFSKDVNSPYQHDYVKGLGLAGENISFNAHGET